MLTPLKITFELDTPMVRSGYPIHLDALVAYAQTQSRLAGYAPEEEPPGSIRTLAEDLPLGKSEQDGEWVWQASALVPERFGEKSVRMWTRKTDVADYAERVLKAHIEIGARTQSALEKRAPYAGKIDTARGLLKAMFEFYPAEEVFSLSAWCIGDIDLLEPLLAPESGWITHIGKRTRIGHGRVKSMTITEDAAAHENWKRRVLPWQEPGYEPLQAAFRPPYWVAENRAFAYSPAGLAC